jgi:hypothetical protein
MRSRRLLICDDLVAYASQLPARRLRTKLLQTALRYLREERERQLTEPLHLLPKPAILDIGASLKFDRWALYPKFGDPPLTWRQYLDNRVSLIESEINAAEVEGFQMLRLSPVESASRDVWSRHGLSAVLPFLKTCWRDKLIISLDDFFWVMHTAVRSEAFGLEWQEAWEEMMEAGSEASKNSSNEHVNSLVTRARRIAEIDAKKARDAKPLDTIARRELQRVQELLAKARLRPFSGFLREIQALRPVYYTLRDIWYELHFLVSDPKDRVQYEFEECLVDEMQADIGQMVCYPLGGPMLADVLQWNGRSVAHCHRRLNFWEHSRIQVNHAIAQNIRTKLDLQGNVDTTAVMQELQALLSASISKGQRLGMTMLDGEIKMSMEEETHGSA